MPNEKISDEILQATAAAMTRAGGVVTQAAALLNVNYNTFRSRLREAERRGIYKRTARVTGTSTLYDQAGNQVLQWVKEGHKEARQEDTIRAACEALTKKIKPAKPVKTPKNTSDDLLNQFIFTDYHIGQLSWLEETGEAWNTDIAERLLYGWLERALMSAPKADTAALVILGDFLHYDGLDSVTPTGKHPLDADARFQKIVQVAVRVIDRLVNELLKTHKFVKLVICEGNHDIASSIWLKILFKEKYKKEPRLTVDENPTPYYCITWGETSLFYHHGHKRPFKDVSRVFAGLYRNVYGKTRYSYAHMGHLHHAHLKEDQLMVVEQHPTLAAKDAHATRGGYLSSRGASVITYSKRFGEVSRVTIRPEMVGFGNV